MTVYGENPVESRKNYKDFKNEFSKVSRYKVKIQKYLYI